MCFQLGQVITNAHSINFIIFVDKVFMYTSYIQYDMFYVSVQQAQELHFFNVYPPMHWAECQRNSWMYWLNSTAGKNLMMRPIVSNCILFSLSVSTFSEESITLKESIICSEIEQMTNEKPRKMFSPKSQSDGWSLALITRDTLSLSGPQHNT